MASTAAPSRTALRLASERLRGGWVLALPALFSGALAFRAGGFFADSTGIAAVVAALLLAARVTVARRPFAGMSRLLGVALAALTALAVWTLLSGLWSDSAVRAATEFDRALLYLLVAVLAGSMAQRPGSLGTALRWTAAIIGVVCVAALASRLLPGTFPTRAGLPIGRLSFPLTYWNALGIFAAVGIALCTHFSASPVERPVVRVAAAALLPILAVTLYLTLSRGGIAGAIVALVAYVILARPRPLISVLVSAGPAVAVAVVRAYAARVLVQVHHTGPQAVAAGRSVAVVVVLCVAGAALLRALMLPVDARLEAIRLPDRVRRPALAVMALVLVGALVVGGAAANLPSRLSRARVDFERSMPAPTHGDIRQRLTDLGNNGRIQGWRVAWHAFESDPWKGTGAGTYALVWERHRPSPPTKIVDAHSLYLESLAELGIPGLAMLLVAVVALLVAGLRGLRGPGRYASAAFVAAGVALLLHAGVDWDWEMPAVMAWFFGAGAVAAAARGEGVALEPARLTRLLAGLGCLVLALTPAAVAASQVELDNSARAFARGDCTTAVSDALTSLSRFPGRPEPFEILGYCDVRGGRPDLALKAMASARGRDPHDWEYDYATALARGAAGLDPRPAARRALRLDPLGTEARTLVARLHGARTRARWRHVVFTSSIPSE